MSAFDRLRNHFGNIIPHFFSIRTLVLTILYSAIIFITISFAYMIRFDFEPYTIADHYNMEAIAFVILVKLFFLVVFGQFRGMLSYFHTPDLISIFWAHLLSFFVFYAAYLGDNSLFLFTKGVLLVDFTLSLVVFAALRLLLRGMRERRLSSSPTPVYRNVVIVGAGDIGYMLASDLYSHRNMGLTPCVFLDEDPGKIGKYIMGLPVEPLSADFISLKHRYALDTAVIAIANLNIPKLRDISARFKKVGINVNLVPSYHDLALGKSKVSRLREIDITDVLGREPVKLDSDNIDAMVRNRSVMVTGAGGSIGSELCRQIAERSPSLLILVEQCEVQLFAIEQDLISREYGIALRPVVGNIADVERMDYIMKRFKPDIIFHAAAHKHVPIMEAQPGEALKNNSIGTWLLAETASKNNVSKFVLISTDKAINPTNAMGASKRLAEMAVQAMQSRPENKTQFAAVRFGNVLGSSGSVIPTFKRQIAEGGPVTVTHPDVTRFFMTIPEAVGLVLQCGAQASGGEIFVLNMGDPVKIIDLARQLITLSGYRPDIDIPIKIVGLRPGEKLYEELQRPSETLVETSHPRIYGFISKPPTYEYMAGVVEELKRCSNGLGPNRVKEAISKFLPEYNVQFYD